MKLYGEISKVETNDDGTLTVCGYASSEVVDADGEVIKADAIKAALPEFFKYGGTGPLREMHQAIAAGVVESADVQDDGRTFISARVVDPGSVKKVQAGVLKGFSVGGKRLPGGYDPINKIISKMRLTEISLVDRPNNPEAVITMWKGEDMATETDKGADESADKTADVAKTETAEAEKTETVEHPVKVSKADDAAVDELAKMLNSGMISISVLVDLAKADIDSSTPKMDDLIKREFSDKQRQKLADKGHALPDGSFPIETKADLKNAIESYGRAKDKAAAKAHIIERAKALGAEDELPKDWMESEKSEQAADIKKGIYTAAQAMALLDALNQLQQSTEIERDQEGDDSKIPDELKQLCQAFGNVIKDMVAEEIDELTEYEDEDGTVAMAASIGDVMKVCLVPKAYKGKSALIKKLSVAKPEELDGILKEAGAKIAKAGARHSKVDAAHLQAIHDHACAMGADCKGDDAEKVEKAEITKALGIKDGETLLDVVKVLRTDNDDLKKRLAAIEAQPAPSRAVLKFVTVDKTQDVGTAGTAKAVEVEPVRKADGSIDDVATAIKKVHASGGNIQKRM